MPHPHPHPDTRRAFCQGVARYTALAGLLGMTSFAVLRRPSAASACPRTNLCQGCPTAPTCSLPEKQPNLEPQTSNL